MISSTHLSSGLSTLPPFLLFHFIVLYTRHNVAHKHTTTGNIALLCYCLSSSFVEAVFVFFDNLFVCFFLLQFFYYYCFRFCFFIVFVIAFVAILLSCSSFVFIPLFWFSLLLKFLFFVFFYVMTFFSQH